MKRSVPPPPKDWAERLLLASLMLAVRKLQDKETAS